MRSCFLRTRLYAFQNRRHLHSGLIDDCCPITLSIAVVVHFYYTNYRRTRHRALHYHTLLIPDVLDDCYLFPYELIRFTSRYLPLDTPPLVLLPNTISLNGHIVNEGLKELLVMCKTKFVRVQVVR